jgi:hypothetical protein
MRSQESIGGYVISQHLVVHQQQPPLPPPPSRPTKLRCVRNLQTAPEHRITHPSYHLGYIDTEKGARESQVSQSTTCFAMRRRVRCWLGRRRRRCRAEAYATCPWGLQPPTHTHSSPQVPLQQRKSLGVRRRTPTDAAATPAAAHSLPGAFSPGAPGRTDACTASTWGFQHLTTYSNQPSGSPAQQERLGVMRRPPAEVATTLAAARPLPRAQGPGNPSRTEARAA